MHPFFGATFHVSLCFLQNPIVATPGERLIFGFRDIDEDDYSNGTWWQDHYTKLKHYIVLPNAALPIHLFPPADISESFKGPQGLWKAWFVASVLRMGCWS